MGGQTVKRLLRRIRVLRKSLSREGNIGIVLLGLSLIAYFFLLAPAETRSVKLKHDVMSLSSLVHSTKNHKLQTPITASDELGAFYHFFPSSTSAPDWLEKIFSAAQKQHLELNEGKYRVKYQRAGTLIRYQIMFPITGNYRQIHAFLASVLSEVPNAALDGVRFERRKIGDTRIEAKIKITIYLGQKS